MQSLPSTTGLLAFEAAARHLSFVHAARELHVTPDAVSRQIQSLEEFLGARLFYRHHKRVELTPLGREYLAEIRASLERIAASTARIRGAAGTGAISICAYPTFAIRWLIPRWGVFYDRHPDIDVRLTTSLTPVDFRRDEYDMAMQVMGTGTAWTGIMAHKLIDVELFPICSASLAHTIQSEDDLAHATLIHGAPRPLDWPRWLAAAGFTNIDSTRGLRFESLNLAIQAAIEGLGVAIGIEALIRDDIAQGRLVRLFEVSRLSSRPIHLVYPVARAMDRKLIAFRDWLLQEAEPSITPGVI